MENEMNVSFIVIGRNEGWRLLKCLKAVFGTIEQHKELKSEVVYVDSKSSDGSIDNVRKFYPDVKIFLITGDCNAAIGRNVGGMMSSGKIMIFLDGDMEFQSNFLDEILNANGELKFSFCNGMGWDMNYTPSWKFIDRTPEHHIVKNTFCNRTGGFFVIDRKLWNEVGGMDNKFNINEDINLGICMYLKGYKMLKYAKSAYNHYTIPYASRPGHILFSIKNQRFPMLIVRAHLFNRKMLKYNLRRLFFPVFFLLTIIYFVLCFDPLVLLPYIICSVLRTFRESKKMFFSRLITFVCCDLSQIIAFLCFFPKKHKEEFIQV